MARIGKVPFKKQRLSKLSLNRSNCMATALMVVAPYYWSPLKDISGERSCTEWLMNEYLWAGKSSLSLTENINVVKIKSKLPVECHAKNLLRGNSWRGELHMSEKKIWNASIEKAPTHHTTTKNLNQERTDVKSQKLWRSEGKMCAWLCFNSEARFVNSNKLVTVEHPFCNLYWFFTIRCPKQNGGQSLTYLSRILDVEKGRRDMSR